MTREERIEEAAHKRHEELRAHFAAERAAEENMAGWGSPWAYPLLPTWENASEDMKRSARSLAAKWLDLLMPDDPPSPDTTAQDHVEGR